jgi:DNA-binding NarL/FixJ family response regulator
MSVHTIDDHAVLPVAICERRQFDRAALRALCSHDDRLRVVAEAARGEELIELLPGHDTLVVLIGCSTVREEGPGLVRHIRSALPGSRIVVVGVNGEFAAASPADVGADAFLARDGDLADQLAAVYG